MRGALAEYIKFLSTPSARRATDQRRTSSVDMYQFLSTPSARRATHELRVDSRPEDISIHALCEEGDPCDMSVGEQAIKFLSTPSARRATEDAHGNYMTEQISIHALCEEGDFFSVVLHPAQSDFYPRPLRGGRP